MAYIGSQITLTCKMSKTDVSIFIKSGVAIYEHGRFVYAFEDSGSDQFVGNLEITNITKEDGGNYTCLAYKNGLTSRRTYTLRTGLYMYFSIIAQVIIEMRAL